MQPWFYTRLYRQGAAWDRYGVGGELVDLVDSGRLSPQTHPRVLDLGSGTGAVSVHLAERGFEVVGVDFTALAVERARQRAADAGVADRCRFVCADLTQDQIPGCTEPFDLLIDYSTIDDGRPPRRRAMASTVLRCTRPGSLFFMWCFAAAPRDLPWVARGRMSRLLHQTMVPGEVEQLFGDAFAIETLPVPPRPAHAHAYLMTRR